MCTCISLIEYAQTKEKENTPFKNICIIYIFREGHVAQKVTFDFKPVQIVTYAALLLNVNKQSDCYA